MEVVIMAKRIPMIGRKFGKLTVIEEADDEILSNGSRTARYKCKCDCNNVIIVRGTSLRNGHTTSCGCSRSTSMIGVLLEDLTGQRFGRWTVLYQAESQRDKRNHVITMWHCRCDCGTERDIRAQTLKAGTSKSCGCYKANRLERDLTGQMFGRWTVIGQGLDKFQCGRTYRTWTCMCECGNVRDVVEASLVSGKSTSCGCLRKERCLESRTYEDLTGQRFGKWTVLQKLPSRKYDCGGYAQMWECKCDCGTVKAVSQCLLKAGYTRSCGCSVDWQLESDVRTYLEEYNIEFQSQKMFDGLVGLGGLPLRYDFYVIYHDVEVLIECQGEQHYRPVEYFGGEDAFFRRTMHDSLKKEYARDHDIKFVEIPYTNRTSQQVFSTLDSVFATI